MNLDGTGFKPLVENDEPDLEFYDGTYLPDGRVIAISNIGYQGVPCVNGSDAVGNMVPGMNLAIGRGSPRLTFTIQDANWNPVIMNNGRVMYNPLGVHRPDPLLFPYRNAHEPGPERKTKPSTVAVRCSRTVYVRRMRRRPATVRRSSVSSPATTVWHVQAAMIIFDPTGGT
ncbi:MAG: hypothetical protein ACLR6J_12330 [Parabacteroides merdae]